MDAVMESHIEINPAVRRGRPCIAGTRITVTDLITLHLRKGLSLEEIAGKYDLSLAAIHAAMTYYYDHRSEIEQSLEEDKAFAEAFRRNNPAVLQEKLSTNLQFLALIEHSRTRQENSII